MDFDWKILTEITAIRETEGDNREAEAKIRGLKRALELWMGTAEARQFLTDNGEDSN
jgi:hypothetical protein